MKTVSVFQNSTVVELDLISDHEEADTRLLLQAKNPAITHPKVVIQSPDIDVVILSVAHFEDLQCQELWFKTGVKDKQRYIPIHSIHSFLGKSLSNCLQSFHAVTGCDSTSAFSGIGKIKARKVLTQKHIQCNLNRLGENSVLHDDVHKVAESFLCSLYTSAKSFSNANKARYFLFCQKSQELPPTPESLSYHIKRANYQACVWKRALVPLQNLPSPEGNGWQMKDGKLSPVLMTRNPAPRGIIELAKCGCTTSECKKNCSCKKSELPCTEACLCMADEGCCNPLNENLVYYDDD